MSDGVSHQFSTAEWNSHLLPNVVSSTEVKRVLVLSMTVKEH